MELYRHTPVFRGRSVFNVLKDRIPRNKAWDLARAVKHASNPLEYGKRTLLARKFGVQPTPELERLGYHILDAEQIGPTKQLISDCNAQIEQMKQKGELKALRNNSAGGEMRAIIRGGNLLHINSVREFLLKRELIKIVVGYFGTVPLLAGMAILWTHPNQTAYSSQLFHRDKEDRRQLKLFVFLNEVDADTGPLTVIPAQQSTTAVAKLNYKVGKLSDESFKKIGLLDHQIAFTGRPGTSVLVDTSRCFHYGSRHNRKDRFVLMAQFTSFFAPLESTSAITDLSVLNGMKLDDIQRSLLGVTPA